MKSFKDAAGREWQIPVVTVEDIRRTHKACGVLICNLKEGEPELFLRLQNDMPLLGQVVFCLLDGQPKKEGVTLEQFLGSLNGLALAAMAEAFWQEMFDFFLPCRPDTATMIAETFGQAEPRGTSR